MNVQKITIWYGTKLTHYQQKLNTKTENICGGLFKIVNEVVAGKNKLRNKSEAFDVREAEFSNACFSRR